MGAETIYVFFDKEFFISKYSDMFSKLFYPSLKVGAVYCKSEYVTVKKTYTT